MFKSYRFRIYPNKAQQETMADNFSCARFVFNQLVKQRGADEPVEQTQERCLIEQLCRDQPWIQGVNPSVVFHAFDNFNFSLQRSRTLNRKLRFKTAKGRESFCLTNFCRSIHINARSVTIGSIGELRARMTRLPNGRIMNTTIIRAGSGRYYMSILTQQADGAVPPVSKKTKVTCIGLDMGIKHFLTRSDGVCIENPRYFEDDLQRLKRLQHDLARKVKDSENHSKHCRKIARLHERIATRRNAFLHKISTQIVRENDIIAVESPGIVEMLGRKQLSRQISDAAWSKFINMLAYKSLWYGKQLIQIDRYHPSSKICCKCRQKADAMPLSIREWQCPYCSTKHDRDTNAAINILIEGVKVYQRENPNPRQQLVPVLSELK